MKFTPLQINKDNERYYSSDYMQGFKDGVKRQCEADNSKIKRGEWTAEEEYGDLWVCNQCGFASEYKDNFCPNCGADMRAKDGDNNETD